jgi:S1-C subfamily serine protease
MLAAACVAVGSAQDQRWSVNFQSSSDTPGSGAATLPSGDDTMVVTVAGQGGDLTKSAVQLGGRPVVAKLVGFDSVSRLCFFKPVKADQAKAQIWLSRAPEKPGTPLNALTKEGPVSGRSTGWVKRVGDKVLPLALMRLEFDGRVPMPGTPLTDESGRVAAIVFQKGDTENSVYAIPAEAVYRVLRDIRKGGGLIRGWLGVSLKVENETPKIVRVLPDSPAAEAGIREGDLISRIAGRNIVDYADVANAFFYIVPGEPLSVTIKRGGELLDFTLIPMVDRPRAQ